MLHLKTGEEITGYDRGFEGGNLKWELPLGTTMQVPVGEIDFIEYPPDPALAKENSGPELVPVPDEVPESGSEEESPEKTVELGLPEKIFNNPVEAPEIIYETLSDGFGQTVEVVNDWTRRVELGGRYLEGNSQQESVNISARLEKNTDRYFQQHNLGGQYGKSTDVLISNRWFVNSTFDFKRTDNWVVFIKTKMETDELQRLRHRNSLSSGFGYRFFMEPKKRLICRIGPGVTHENFRNPDLKRTTPDMFGEYEFHWPLTDWIQYEHKTTLSPSLSDISVFRSTSNYGVLFQLDDDSEWSFKMGLRHDYNARPNDDRKRNDYITTVQLVYTRK